MSKEFTPFIAHSEITDEIYVYYTPTKKVCVTDQVIKAMEQTGRIPERKKGKWIFEECKGNTYFRCSECGEIVTSAFMGFPRYEYCPMCGADMRGEEE